MEIFKGKWNWMEICGFWGFEYRLNAGKFLMENCGWSEG
jgi:hypothetical protein